jgi:hypothetical protein
MLTSYANQEQVGTVGATARDSAAAAAAPHVLQSAASISIHAEVRLKLLLVDMLMSPAWQRWVHDRVAAVAWQVMSMVSDAAHAYRSR